MKTIKNILKWCAIIFIALIAIGLILPSENSEEKIKEPVVETETSRNQYETKVDDLPLKKLTTEDRLKELVLQKFKGLNNLDRKKIIDVKTMGGDGNRIALIDFNAPDNSTTNLRVTSLKKEMSQIYKTIYIEFNDIEQVIVTAYFPLIDKYGNEKNGIVYRTKLIKSDANKINWSQNESLLLLDIIPGLWEAYKIHPEFK